MERPIRLRCGDVEKGGMVRRTTRTSKTRPVSGAHAKPADAKDVAKAVGVSLSAVSRSFTKSPGVSQETRERVLATAKRLGYRPNALASAMITRKSRLIAVIITNHRSPFFSYFLEAVNRELGERGFSMMLLLTSDRETADEAVQRAQDYSAEGMILVSAAPSPEVAATAEAKGIPLVVLDRGKGAPTSARVWIDGSAIGREVAERFLAEGRRNPVVVSHTKATAQPTEVAAFTRRMNDAGLGVRAIKLGIDYFDGLNGAPLIFDRALLPDAVFATASLLACGIYDGAINNYGLKVPQDLSIVAVGNAPQLSWPSHPISAANIPVEGLARKAVEVLAERMANPRLNPIRSLVPYEFAWRQSTLPIKQD